MFAAGSDRTGGSRPSPGMPSLSRREVDHAVVLLVATAHVARGDVAIVVATSGLGLLLDEGVDGRPLLQVRGDHHLDDHGGPARSALTFTTSHLGRPPAKLISWPGLRRRKPSGIAAAT